MKINYWKWHGKNVAENMKNKLQISITHNVWIQNCSRWIWKFINSSLPLFLYLSDMLYILCTRVHNWMNNNSDECVFYSFWTDRGLIWTDIKWILAIEHRMRYNNKESSFLSQSHRIRSQFQFTDGTIDGSNWLNTTQIL